MLKLKNEIFIVLLLFTISFGIISISSIKGISTDLEPTYTSAHKISESTTKDTPIEIFEVTGNGVFYAYFNWPGTIGASCTAALINFWSFSALTEEDQKEFGNLGHLRILRCQERAGNLSIVINTTVTNNYTLPLRFYFEVDNDQSLTGAIQDTLYLNFEYYQVDGFNEPTNNVGVGIPSTLIGIGFLAVSSFVLRKRKK